MIIIIIIIRSIELQSDFISNVWFTFFNILNLRILFGIIMKFDLLRTELEKYLKVLEPLERERREKKREQAVFFFI